MAIKFKILRTIHNKVENYKMSNRQKTLRYLKNHSQLTNHRYITYYKITKNNFINNPILTDAWNVISNNISPVALRRACLDLGVETMLGGMYTCENYNTLAKYYACDSTMCFPFPTNKDEYHKLKCFMRNYGFVSPEIKTLGKYLPSTYMSGSPNYHGYPLRIYCHLDPTAPYKLHYCGGYAQNRITMDTFISNYKMMHRRYIWELILNKRDRFIYKLYFGPNLIRERLKDIKEMVFQFIAERPWESALLGTLGGLLITLITLFFIL